MSAKPRATRWGSRASPFPAALAAVALALGAPAPAAAEESKEDTALRTRIESRLSALPEREGAEIEVQVKDGQVLLRGRVRLLEQSLRAEQTTWTTPGVRDVENELRVMRLLEALDEALEREVRRVVQEDARFELAALDVTVRGGLVSIRGVFRDPGDVLALKHRIASIPGVLEVEIDALPVARLDRSGRGLAVPSGG